jgi:hypothetical protein
MEFSSQDYQGYPTLLTFAEKISGMVFDDA